MPGLVGFTPSGALDTLSQVRDMLVHHDFYINDELFDDGTVTATRVSTGLIQTTPQPINDEGIYVWFDGEFYNRDELMMVGESCDAKRLLRLYKQNNDFNFLKLINGVFAAVIYDTSVQKIHLLTDRFGLCYLYWGKIGDGLAWASESKVFTALPNFEARIDPQAVREFLQNGYILENRSWFEDVTLVPSATVVTWDIKKREATYCQYWSWDEIKPLNIPIDEPVVIEELRQRFITAIERRSQLGERIGVFLSGGLDSRLILASIPREISSIHAITFGKRMSPDVKLAAQAARVRSATHHVDEMNTRNWFDGCLSSIWRVDGEASLFHLVALPSAIRARSLFDIMLSGYLGDATIGGSYLNHGHHDEFFLVENRGRRGINQGQRVINSVMVNRYPFFDNDFIELVMQIPPSLRADSYIYNKMLLKHFPAYFRSIPWQQTALPISSSPVVVKLFSKARKLWHTANAKLFRTLGYSYSNPTAFVDYQNWVQQEPIRSLFDGLLRNPNALYREFVSPKAVLGCWEDYLTSSRYVEQIGRYVTFEIWLQQVFQQRYRESYSGSSALYVDNLKT